MLHYVSADFHKAIAERIAARMAGNDTNEAINATVIAMLARKCSTLEVLFSQYETQ